MFKAPLFFIYQNGFRQISLPPSENEYRNTDVINIIECDDGCLINTENLKEDYEKLKKYIGCKVVDIWCDSNEIMDMGILTECSLTKDNYGGDCILVWAEKE